MVKVLDGGADLTGYEIKRCTAAGAVHGSRMVGVKPGKTKLAVPVADTPLKPLEKRDGEDWGHWADWWHGYVNNLTFQLAYCTLKLAKNTPISAWPLVGCPPH